MATAGELVVLIAAKDEASKALDGIGQKLGGLGKLAGVALAGVAAAGAGFTAAIVGAVGAAMDFESAMSAVGAVAGASGAELAALSQTALQLGQDTTLAGVSASDAAKAMAELASGGISVADIMGGAARGALLLASAGGLDVAQAAEIAAAALNNFGLAGSQTGHVADLFAAAANSSAVTVTDLGESMKYIGPIANSMGLSIEEVTAALAELGDQGIKGGQAGTSLRSILSSLAKPSKEASGLIKELGLEFFDAGGKMKSLAGISEQLKTHLSGLTDQQRANALVTLFGNEALSAATVLYGEGADGIAKYLGQVNVAGSAAANGAARNDNLRGSIEQLKSSWETASITLGTAFIPLVRQMVDMLSGAVNAVIPLIAVLGPQFVAALQAGIGQGVAIVQAFGAAVLAMVNSLRTGDFSNLFGPLIVAISTAFGGETAGKVTLFVSNLVTGLNLARDAVLTAKQAFAGDWVSADSIATPVRIIGELFLTLGDAVRTVGPYLQSFRNLLAGIDADSRFPSLQAAAPILLAVGEAFRVVQGWLAQLPAPLLAAVGGFLALGPALSIVGAILPTIIGALTGLGPIVGILTSTLPLLGSVIAAIGFPITALIVAVGLLAAAWINDWGGIQTATMPVITAIGAMITGTLLPALMQAGTFITTTVVPAFQQGWAMVSQAVSNAVTAITPAVQAFVGFLQGSLIPGIQGILAVAGPAFDQMKTAAVGAFQAALPGIQAFIAGAQQLGSAVMPIITQVAGVIINSLGPAIMAMVGWAQTVIPQFAAAFTNVMSIVGPVIGEIASIIGTGLSAIAGFVSDHSAQITAILTDAWNIISGTIGVVFGVITGLISAGLQVIAGDWSGAWETIKQTASTAWDGIQQIVSSAIDLVKNYISVGLSAAKDVATLAWDGIKIAATTAWDGIKTLVSNAIDGLKTTISDGLNAAKDTAKTALDAMATAATTAMDNLKTAIDSGIQSAQDTISNGVSGFADIVLGVGDAMYSAGASIIGRLAAGIDSAIGAAVDKVKAGLQQIANLLPHSEPKDPSSPLRGLEGAGRSIFSMLADGIGRGAPEAIRATQDAAGAIAHSLAETLGNLGTLTDTPSDKSAAGIMRLFAANFAVALDTMRATASAAGDFLDQAREYKSMILQAVTAIKEAQAALNTVNFGGGGAPDIGKNLGDGITKGIKKSLDIHSPSQVMAAIGRDVVAGLVEGMTDAQQDAAKKAADVASAIANAVAAGVAAFTALGSFVAPGAGTIYAFGQTLRLAVNDLAVLSEQISAEMLAAAAKFSEGAVKAVAVYGSGVSALAGLREYVRPAVTAIYDFGKDLRLAINDLALLAEQLGTETSDLAGKFGEGVAKATGGIVNAVAGFVALRDYARVPAAALYDFGKDLRLLVQDFAAIVDLIGVDMAEQAGRLGENVGKVTGGIAGAVAGFAALTDFRAPAREAIDALAASVGILLAGIARAARGMTSEGLKLAGDFADAGGKAVAIIGNAVSGFVGLATFVTPGKAAVDGLIATIRYVIARFGEMAKEMSTEGLTQTTLFGEATQSVLGGVKAAIDTFIALDKAVVPRTGDLSDLVIAVQGVTRNMAKAAAELGDKAIADATAFGTAANGIFTALKAGLDLFIQIDKPGGWPTTDWLQPLIELMSGMLSRGGALLSQAQQLKAVADQFNATMARAYAGFATGLGGGGLTLTGNVGGSGLISGGGGTTIVNNYTVTGNTMLGRDDQVAYQIAQAVTPQQNRTSGYSISG